MAVSQSVNQFSSCYQFFNSPASPSRLLFCSACRHFQSCIPDMPPVTTTSPFLHFYRPLPLPLLYILPAQNIFSFLFRPHFTSPWQLTLFVEIQSRSRLTGSSSVTNYLSRFVKTFSLLSDKLLIRFSFFQENFVIDQHKSLLERLEAVKILISQKPSAPVLVDPMDNETMKSYASFPERFYIIHEGRVVYDPGYGPQYYHPRELRMWLEAWKS